MRLRDSGGGWEPAECGARDGGRGAAVLVLGSRRGMGRARWLLQPSCRDCEPAEGWVGARLRVGPEAGGEGQRS